MNINIITIKMKGLLNKYNKLTLPDNENVNQYAYFRFAYINYYKPFQLYFLKDFKKALDVTKEPIENYKDCILDIFFDVIKEDLERLKHKDSEFTEKLSESIYNEFNLTLKHYKTLNSEYKKNFMNQFVKNKEKALLIILEKSPYLFLKTVANIRSPLMQFYITNKISEVTNSLPTWFLTFNDIELKIILIQYFFYPLNVDPKSYYNLWEGESLIHIKFAKNIMGEKYDFSKEFLKLKHQFEIEYLTEV